MRIDRHGNTPRGYAMPMTPIQRILMCRICESIGKASVDTISTAALNRWVIPRSIRDQKYLHFQRNQILEQIRIGNELESAIDAEEQMEQLAIL